MRRKYNFYLIFNMNYLAHLFLSCEIEDHLVGNFIADSIRHAELADFSPMIKQGVELHKHIDTFTDNHPIVKQSTKRLHSKHGKYSPLVVDIWYDHLLTRHWESYTTENLRSFADRMYRILYSRIHLMPKRMQKNLPLMIEDDWLMRYVTLLGMYSTFERFKYRLSRPELLADVITNLERMDTELDADFQIFFPDLMNYIHTHHHQHHDH